MAPTEAQEGTARRSRFAMCRSTTLSSWTPPEEQGTKAHRTWRQRQRRGRHGQDGAAGKARPRAAGSPDVPEAEVKRDAVWWSYVVPALGGRAQEWAKYRTRVGEYRFRNYKPGSIPFRVRGIQVPLRVTSLRLQALHEFTIAMRLWTHADEARQLAQYINFNQSPIGVPYNHYLVPDFARYEEVVTDYGPMVQSLFEVASDLLTNAADISNNRGRLAGELGHVQGLATALDSDQHAAEIGAEATKAELELAKTRLATNQAKLDALHEQMQDESMELAGKILGTVAAVATAVVAVAGAVYTSGASLGALAAIPGLLVDIEGRSTAATSTRRKLRSRHSRRYERLGRLEHDGGPR